MFADATEELRAAAERNFLKWFGASQIVERGAPKVVYHGTNTYFDEFKASRTAEGGLFFTACMDHALGFGERILPVFLSIQSPMIVDGSTFPEAPCMDEMISLIETAKNKNLDGIIIRGFRDAGFIADTYIVFDGRKIKSARSNSGQFSTRDITFEDLGSTLPGIKRKSAELSRRQVCRLWARASSTSC
jgi:hypothetical protein